MMDESFTAASDGEDTQDSGLSRPPTNSTIEVPPMATNPQLLITVTDPETNAKGKVVYKVSTEVDLDGYLEKQYSVLRRYSEFDWLMERLILECPQVNVPLCPPKDFRVGQAQFDPRFLNQRAQLLQKFMQKISVRDSLASSPALKAFLTEPDGNPFDYAKKHLPPARDFEEATKSVGMFAKMRSKATVSVPKEKLVPRCEDKYQALVKLHAGLGKLIPKTDVFHFASTAQAVALNEYGETLEEFCQWAEEKNCKGVKELSQSAKAVAEARLQQTQESEDAFAFALVENELALGGASGFRGSQRLYRDRQKALHLIYSTDVTGMDKHECEANYESFDSQLDGELDRTERDFCEDALRLLTSVPLMRKEALLSELRAWDQFEQAVAQHRP